MNTTIDASKLMTVANYAKKIGKSVQWVYELIRAGDVKIVNVDGKKFIQL